MFLFLTSSNIHFQTFKFARYSLMEFSHVISDYLVNFYFDAKDSREDPAAAFLYFIQRYIHTIEGSNMENYKVSTHWDMPSLRLRLDLCITSLKDSLKNLKHSFWFTC
jgi:hypothetical protein